MVTVAVLTDLSRDRVSDDKACRDPESEIIA